LSSCDARRYLLYDYQIWNPVNPIYYKSLINQYNISKLQIHNGQDSICFRWNMRRYLAAFSVWLLLLVLLSFTNASGVERPKIIVGGDHDNPPYEFLENGKPTGFNIELMRAVAEATGIDVEFRLGPWSKVRQELEQGKIDALAGMYYSAERKKQVDFSLPHTMVSAGLFVRKNSPIRSLEDIKGKEVIAQEGDVIHDYLRENNVTSHIVAVTNPEDELRLLASGRHDCALMPSRFQGEYLKHSLRLTDLRAISTVLPPFRYCFAVQKGNQDLLYRLDEGLNILKINGRYQDIYEKWFGVYDKKTLWQTLRYYVLALALSLALFLTFFIWSWTLKKRVEQRTAELHRSEDELREAHDELEKRVEERTTELAETVNALRDSEARYRAIVNAFDGLIYICSQDYRIEFMNKNLVERTGYEAVGESCFKVMHDRDSVCPWCVNDRVFAGETVRWEMLSPKDNRWYYMVNVPVYRANGSLSKYSMIMDITDRKRTESVNMARLRLLQFAATHTLDELLEATLDEAEALTGSLIGFYHFLEADQKTLSLQNCSTRTKKEFCKAEGKGLHYDVSAAGVWVDCIHQRRPVIHNDYASIPYRKGLPPGHAPVVRELVVPVFRGENIVAILGVGNKPHDYTPEDIETVSLLADLVWEIAESKRAEEALRLSQFCIDKAGIGIFQSDGTGTIFNVNDYACKSLGYSREELCALSVFDIDPEITPERMLELKEILDERGSVTHHTTHRRRDGMTFPVEITANILDFKGKKYGISFVKDITERREAEESLKRAKEEWERTFASVPDLIAILDNRHRVLRVNEAMAKRLGLRPDECVGLHCYEAIHGLSESPPFCPHTQTLMDGRKHVVEVHEERLGGDFLVSTIPLNDERGVMIGSVHIAYDITERKRAEEALRESEQRYRTVADYTYGWEYWIAPDGSLNYVSPSCERISGYSADEFIANPGLLISIIHPKDRPKAERHLLKVSNGEPSSGSHEEDFRIIRRDGSECWVAHACQQVFAADGRYLGRRASNRDITDRKQADEALRESESRVKRKLESILDPEGDIGELELSDILDTPEIQTLMDDLYRNTGLKMSIIDLKGRVLVDVGWQDICLKFHRAHPETLKNCHESDTDLTVGVPPGEFRTYRCKNNMWHLVTPIFVGERHIGNLFMGQFFFENEELDYDLFRAQARQYGFPEEEYIAALEAVPRHSEECVNKGKVFFLRLTDMFSKLSYGNIKLARSLAERDRLMETLRQANLVVENSPVVLFRWKGDDEWPVELVSGNITRFGYTPDEFLSRSITYSSIIHPDDLERVTREVHDLCNEGADQFRLEYRIMNKGGDVRWVNEHSNVERDADGCVKNFEGIVIDVTERKLAEDAIRESRAKYQAIVDSFDGLIYISSQDYRIEFMNRKLIERTGRDAVGEYCYKVMNDLDSVCPWCVNDRVFRGETVHREMFSSKDSRWYYAVNVPIRHADGSMSKHAMIFDITDRKMFEEELKRQKQLLEELNRTLEKRVQEEVKKNREKDIILIQQNRQAALGELFDHIAHQWKQPLNSIAVIIQALGSTCAYEQVATKDILETVDRIMDMVGHMAQTVEVFRNFYKPDKEKSVFLVKDSIDKALSFVTPVFIRYGIGVNLDTDPELSAFGYPKEYAQVLLNILANAKDALSERGVENPRIDITAFADGDNTVVTITDNAGGIPDESIGRIFDLYYTTKESSGGSGIGLYMSKNIIEKNMGGKLSVRNSDNGAQFRIELGKS